MYSLSVILPLWWMNVFKSVEYTMEQKLDIKIRLQTHNDTSWNEHSYLTTKKILEAKARPRGQQDWLTPPQVAFVNHIGNTASEVSN